MTSKLGNYKEIDNVFNYQINNCINTKFKTTIFIVPKKELKKHRENKGNYISNITKQQITLINKSNKLDKTLDTLFDDICKHLCKDKAKESQITLQIVDKSNKKFYINFVYLVFDDIKNKKNEIYKYKYNDALRELGYIVYKNLKFNLFNNVNLFCEDTDNLLLLLEGFLLSMYEFKKYKKGKLPKFKDQLIHHKFITSSKNNDINNNANNDSKNDLSKTSNINNDNNNNEINNSNQNGGTTSKKNSKKTKNVKTKKKKQRNNNQKKTVKLISKKTDFKSELNNNYFLNLIVVPNNKKASDSKTVSDSKLKYQIDNLLITIKSVYLCRDLVNEPSNVLTPKTFCDFTKTFINKHKLPINIKIFEPEELKNNNMNLLHSVGQGSTKDKQSRLIILEYNGFNKSSKDKSSKDKKINPNKNIVLIGKGVTHDTGGLSIKGSSMSEMKTDMAGGAIVLSTILACAQLKTKHNIVCMIPLAENSIGNKATIPSHVITGYGGISVEIKNTDAEGRLLMADCLSYACKHYKKYQLLDIATLTGSQGRLSCQKFSTAVQVNSFKLTNKLIKSGELVGERIVPLPYINDFTKEIKSDIADIKNVSSSCRGGLYPSSTFLSKFIKENSKWIHIDIGANELKLKTKYPYKNQEASGLGVKLLLSMLN